MADQTVSNTPNKRLLQLHADRNVQMMNRLMRRIRMDIATVAKSSKDIEDFQKNIAFYTTVNVFTSKKYRAEVQEVVDNITQTVR